VFITGDTKNLQIYFEKKKKKKNYLDGRENFFLSSVDSIWIKEIMEYWNGLKFAPSLGQKDFVLSN
jgi:hypothetical protein